MTSTPPKPTLTYADSGVDIDAGNAFVQRIKAAVGKTRRPEVLAGLGGFGALFAADFGKYKEPVLVSSTDGVGTKLLLLHDRPRVAGQDVVAMCVNDLAAQGAEPLFFLDYLACGKIEQEALAGIVEGIADACAVCGCSLIGGETAEMPGMYAPGHFDVAGFTVGVVDRAQIIDGSTISDGDVLLGLASSGPHSNGYSLVRKLLQVGNADLSSDRLSDGTLAADSVLAPTRLYVPAVKAMMAAKIEVHGLSHITGGGLFDNIERLLPEHLTATINTASWPMPPVFEYLLGMAEVPFAERYRTFNMGIGFVAILPASQLAAAEAVLAQAGETTFRIGTIGRRSGGEAVSLVGETT